MDQQPFGKIASNGYAEAVGGLFNDIPKTVWAALAVSFATMGGDRIDDAALLISREWQALYDAGIVSQKPNREARAVIAAGPDAL